MRLPLTKLGNIALTIITVRRMLSPLCLLLLVRPGGSIVTLRAFYFYKLIGKLIAFLQLQEFSLRNPIVPVPLPPRDVLGRADGDDEDEAGYSEDDHAEDEDGAASHSKRRQSSSFYLVTNGGTQGVAQHFLKYHAVLNARIRALKVLPGAAKNPPDFMTLLNHAIVSRTHTFHCHYHCVTDTHFPLSLTPTSI
jgi:hypothetical protein